MDEAEREDAELIAEICQFLNVPKEYTLSQLQRNQEELDRLERIRNIVNA